MSLIDGSEVKLHNVDWSHRWVAPLGTDQAVWEHVVRAHLQEHSATLAGWTPPPADDRGDPRGGRATRPTGGGSRARA